MGTALYYTVLYNDIQGNGFDLETKGHKEILSRLIHCSIKWLLHLTGRRQASFFHEIRSAGTELNYLKDC